MVVLVMADLVIQDLMVLILRLIRYIVQAIKCGD
jgi:hypothetical protein